MRDLLAALHSISPLLGAYLGACIASFINVVCYRVPIMDRRRMSALAREVLALDPEDPKDGLPVHFDLVKPNSHCPSCQAPIPFFRNIPILTYVVQRGRCARCPSSIPVRYFFVELMGAAFGLVLGFRFGLSPELFLFLAGMGLLLTLALIDFDHQYISEPACSALLWLGLIGCSLHLDHLVSASTAVITAVGAWSFMRMVRGIFDYLQRDSMGDGDEIVAAAIAVWAGPTLFFFTLLAAVMIQSLILSVNFVRTGRNTTQPFIPYLALTTIIGIGLHPAWVTLDPVKVMGG